MRVILYKPDYGGPTTCAANATRALSAGLKNLGVEHSYRSCKTFEGEIADVAIVNGWLKDYIRGLKHKNRIDVIEAQAAAGKPAWCIERGFLGDREMWSAMSIGGFAATGDFRVKDMPPDRWIRLGIELKPWCTGRSEILLCGQVPWDAQVDGGNHLAWLEQTALEIRKHTDRVIRFRPHPKAFRRKDPYKALSPEFRALVVGSPDHTPAVPFELDLFGAHAVVCFNSNVATLALVAGVRAFTSAPSLADPLAYRSMESLDDPHLDVTQGLIDRANDLRSQWAWDLAYKQWHLDEFRRALPWLHLTR